MPTINVNDAYVLNETGAEVDKVTGLFTKNENATTGEKQMARLNIAAGGSNDNLLDNAYFVGGGSQLGDGIFPINQRGLLNYSAGYTIDRWKLSSGGTLVFTNDGISIDGLFFQKKVIDFTVGETYTLSRQTTDGNVVSVTGVVPSTEGWMIGDQTFGVYFRPSTKVCDIQIWGTYLLKAVKLEKGTISTIKNDPVPDFGEELRKCQRYFVRLKADIIYQSFGLGITDSADGTSASYTVPIPLPTALRTATTNVTFSNIAGFDGTAFRTISSILLIRISGTVPVATIVFSLLGSFTNGQPVLLLANQAGAYIDISAEL